MINYNDSGVKRSASINLNADLLTPKSYNTIIVQEKNSFVNKIVEEGTALEKIL